MATRMQILGRQPFSDGTDLGQNPRAPSNHEHHKPVGIVNVTVEKHFGDDGKLELPDDDSYQLVDQDLRGAQRSEEAASYRRMVQRRVAHAAKDMRIAKLLTQQVGPGRLDLAKEFSAQVAAANAAKIRAAQASTRQHEQEAEAAATKHTPLRESQEVAANPRLTRRHCALVRRSIAPTAEADVQYVPVISDQRASTSALPAPPHRTHRSPARYTAAADAVSGLGGLSSSRPEEEAVSGRGFLVVPLAPPPRVPAAEADLIIIEAGTPWDPSDPSATSQAEVPSAPDAPATSTPQAEASLRPPTSQRASASSPQAEASLRPSTSPRVTEAEVPPPPPWTAPGGVLTSAAAARQRMLRHVRRASQPGDVQQTSLTFPELAEPLASAQAPWAWGAGAPQAATPQVVKLARPASQAQNVQSAAAVGAPSAPGRRQSRERAASTRDAAGLARIAAKVEELGVTVPPLCSCRAAEPLDPHYVDKCCRNCPLAGRRDEHERLLTATLQALGVFGSQAPPEPFS